MPDPEQTGSPTAAGEIGEPPVQEPQAPDAPAPDPADLLRQAEAKAQQLHDAWLRAKAEADNIRKRTAVELANAYKYAIESVAVELLPVKDGLEATLAADSASLESLKSGVELTLKQLNTVFGKAGLKEINPAGEKFDPHRHQAISMLPSEKEPNTVINVLQKGYSLHDRVVRPALVTVAKPKDVQA
ncbi:MAG TPA: nucleotide exchange factor GrpE [Burkholderiales bacterium]|nr:nucleotide exchange factor GrpE [Burkholderiales bacterium]